MPTRGQITLALLHDLALVYLGLAHGADGDLSPEETHTIAAKLRYWQPDKDPALIDHIIREATLTYLNESRTERVAEAVDALRDALSPDLRQSILEDLRELASADGTVVSGETRFIDHIASTWTLENSEQGSA